MSTVGLVSIISGLEISAAQNEYHLKVYQSLYSREVEELHNKGLEIGVGLVLETSIRVDEVRM